MEFNIVSYSRGPIEFNVEFWKNLHDKKDVDIDLRCNLRYNIKSPYVGFQFDISANFNNNIFLKIGFLFGIIIPELQELLKDGSTLENHRDVIAKLLHFIWPGVIGVVASQTAQFEALPFMLPDINEEELAKEVIVTQA